MEKVAFCEIGNKQAQITGMLTGIIGTEKAAEKEVK